MEKRYSAYKSDQEYDDAPEFLKDGQDLSNKKNFRRQPCPAIDPSVDKIEFMQIDVDYYTGLPSG